MNKELLQIRKVRPEDARNWFILENKVWRDAYSHIFSEEVFAEKDNQVEEKAKTFSDKMKNDNENIAYVAEYAGEIIGIMCGSIKSSYDKFNSDYADLIALYVDPRFQNLGIGSRFKETFEEWAIENGATQYVIGVLKGNTKARKVYESWGGRLSEYEEDFVKLGIGYPEVFYTYDLQKKLINKLNYSYKFVCDNSDNVRINYSKIDEMIDQIKNSAVVNWLDSNPYGLMDMDVKSIINFLFIYHAIGDYCFWGDPKWEIQTDLGTMDGSYAIMYLILDRFKSNNNFEISFDEFKKMLKGNVPIPLLEDRYNNLVKMNNFLKKSGESFYNLIKDLNVDSQLFEFIVSNLDYFEDVSTYDGVEILFYKRAQLLTSDILHVREKKEQANVDYSHLIGCADYKIPQVMRCYGMLQFSDSLADRVDNKIELEENSKDEIEIRANTLKVINYIYEKLDRKYSRMDINDFIWLLGQDKAKMIKPYHRTLTNHY